jgi:ferredoxin
MTGAGPVQVDLNKYNLPIERIEEEWECHLYQTIGKSDEEGSGVRLQCKSNDVFVDTVTVKFPRQQASLGLELLELAGGRDDGLGITVVSGVVEGGPAENCDVQVGDSISQVSVLHSRKVKESEGITDIEQIFSVPTEALGYDATVEALQTLPPLQDGQQIQLKLRRLRKRPIVTVNLQFPPSQNEPDTTIQLFAGENLRQGMLVRGVKLNDPLAKRFDTKNGGNCGAGGLCRTCAVSISSGQELLNQQRIAEKQMLQDVPRWRLACKAIVGYGMAEGEMTIRVSPNQW